MDFNIRYKGTYTTDRLHLFVVGSYRKLWIIYAQYMGEIHITDGLDCHYIDRSSRAVGQTAQEAIQWFIDNRFNPHTTCRIPIESFPVRRTGADLALVEAGFNALLQTPLWSLLGYRSCMDWVSRLTHEQLVRLIAWMNAHCANERIGRFKSAVMTVLAERYSYQLHTQLHMCAECSQSTCRVPHEYTGEIYCAVCARNVVQCVDCGVYRHNNDMEYIEPEEYCQCDVATGYHCDTCASRANDILGECYCRSSQVQDYHSQNRDCYDVPMNHIGCELEVHALYDRNDVPRALIGLDLICESDGSLCSKYGVEIVQPRPAALLDTVRLWQTVALKLKDTCERWTRQGYGFHVSICHDGWSKFKVAKFLAFYDWNEDLVFKVGGRQWCSSYAQKPEVSEYEVSTGYLESEKHSRYCGVSLRGNGRLEIRVPRSNLGPLRLGANIELAYVVSKYVDVCQTVDLTNLDAFWGYVRNHAELYPCLLRRFAPEVIAQGESIDAYGLDPYVRDLIGSISPSGRDATETAAYSFAVEVN